MLKTLTPLFTLLILNYPEPILASEAVQIATCNYYQGEKVIKTDSSCIVYVTMEQGIYQGKIFWQDDHTITRFSGNLNASLSNAIVDERPVTREDQGLGAYCYTFLDNKDRLCIGLKN